MKEIDDPRDDPLYSLEQVMSLGILTFACRIKSRDMLDRISDDAHFCDNWCTFSRARTETVMCSRQLTNVLASLDRQQLAELCPKLLRRLIRQKQVPSLYLLGYVMIGGDATGIFSSSKKHCDECLTQEHKDGSKTYLHNVLELKALGLDGLAISVLTEPLLNPADGCYDKQDCETKAFHRALPRLKELFPREPIVHLLDSLYCQGPIFKAIMDATHKFICSFQRGSIPTLYDEAIELLKYSQQDQLYCTVKRDGKDVTQVYKWVNMLDYQKMKLNFILCEETVDGKTTTFTYLTNFTVTKENVITIAQGGRTRWKIENEGFNEQKTGYELEHFCNCKDLNVMLCLYILLQIAHLFMQLLARSNLIEDITNLTFLAYLLLESLRNMIIPEEIFDPDQPRCQIRFAKAPT
ncbi:MAG: hypothetical protein WCK01_05865 [Candidatus Uhrbacteria bacterium]